MINNGLDQTHTFIEIVASHTLTSQWAQPRQTARPLPPTAAWDLSLPPQLFLHTHEGSWFLILRGLSASFLPSSTPPTYSSPSSTNQTCTPSRPPSPWGSHSSLFVFSPVLNVHHRLQKLNLVELLNLHTVHLIVGGREKICQMRCLAIGSDFKVRLKKYKNFVIETFVHSSFQRWYEIINNGLVYSIIRFILCFPNVCSHFMTVAVL